MGFDQIGIMLTGATAIFLSQSKSERLRKWACVFGCLGQPFWFWTTYTNEQWGIFCMAFLYTFSWLRGVWNFWVAPAIGARRAGTKQAAHDGGK